MPKTSLHLLTRSALITCAIAAGGLAFAGERAPTTNDPTAASARLAECSPVASSSRTLTTAAHGDVKTRAAAQKGLDYLQERSVAWSKTNNCFGCHVHAVTVEAFSVGEANQYNIERDAFDVVMGGMTTAPGGSRSAGGLQYHGGSLQAPSKGFGGSAFARYDKLVDNKVRDDLLTVAAELLTFQKPEGQVLDPGNWTNGPVGVGSVQLTTQSMATWRQAYERTGDDRWLTATSKAGKWIESHADQSQNNGDHQDIFYTLLGMVEAGGTRTEGRVNRLADVLMARQGGDGGWSLHNGNGSDAFATGQALYVLRLLGYTDKDVIIAKGTQWLLTHQKSSGGWSEQGFGKAEAMWAVMGLVSVDVVSLELAGVEDGQHVRDLVELTATATDNDGGGVANVVLYVDDVLVDSICGASLASVWDARELADGPHLVEVRATNKAGRTARRRLTVYAGNTWMTRVGSRWEDDGTLISLRNLRSDDGKVTLSLHTLADDGKTAKDTVWTTWDHSRQGAMAFHWNGKDDAGKAQPRERYLARFVLADAKGNVLQTLEQSFLHAAPHEEAAGYAVVNGKVNFAFDEADVQNAVIELVDDNGVVVQSTRSTSSGAYNFRGVPAAKYRVRVKKEGRKAVEQEIEANAAEEVSADVAL
ncbi:MAG: hypothetical protein ACI9MC_001240 [Kiritimatiellia bacterium]|jgi:hypothetical protein